MLTNQCLRMPHPWSPTVPRTGPSGRGTSESLRSVLSSLVFTSERARAPGRALTDPRFQFEKNINLIGIVHPCTFCCLPNVWNTFKSFQTPLFQKPLDFETKSSLSMAITSLIALLGLQFQWIKWIHTHNRYIYNIYIYIYILYI